MIFWRKYRLELRSSMNGRSDDQISPTANRCARSAKAEELSVVAGMRQKFGRSGRCFIFSRMTGMLGVPADGWKSRCLMAWKTEKGN